MDYQRFLGKSESVVAPVVDGAAWLRDRSVRSQAAPGWYRLTVKGRVIEAETPAGAEEVAEVLAGLPLVRGPVIAVGDGWGVVQAGAICLPVALPPADEEPLPFAPLRARAWPIGGLVLWDGLDFDGELEETVRRALEEGRGVDQVKGLPAALRAAFGYAMARATGRELGIPAAPIELGRWLGAIAVDGRPAAEVALRQLQRERIEYAAARRVAAVAVRPSPPSGVDPTTRVERALVNTGARLRYVRRTGDGLLEVRWSLRGQPFVSLVEEASLRVRDSGVCLAGEDDLVTLESLPGVIGQAIDEDVLVITRHDGVDDA